MQCLESMQEMHPGKQRIGKAYLATTAACFASMALGAASGYSSPALPELQSAELSPSLYIDDNTAAWFGSIMPIGAVLAAPISGYLCDRVGRKTVLLSSSVPFVVGWLSIAYANNVGLLFLGRILTGFCCGLVSLAAPVYIAEISPGHLRGLLGSCVQVSVTLGMFMAYAVGATLNWRWLAITCNVFPVLLLISMSFVPETPRWLLMKNRPLEAMRAIIFMNGTQINAELECKLIQDNLSAQPKGRVTVMELLQPRYVKPLCITFALMSFQQLTGISTFFFYMESIFRTSHSKVDPKYSSTIVGAVLVVSTVAGTLLVDRAGRRMLLLISGSIMCINVSTLATYCFLVHTKGKGFQTEYNWLPLVCVCIYFTAFSIGFGPIPWVVTAELLPTRIRGTACSVAAMLNAGFSFIVAKEFNDMVNGIGDYGTYWTYGGICLISCIFVCLCLPETKGKTLEDIENLFVSDRSFKTFP